MQSEDYDKKIREAAERHHPAYDETAWAGMEKLLDKHLPQEKEKKRRVLLILLFILLLGCGVFVYYGTGKKQDGRSLVDNQNRKVDEIKTGTGTENKTRHQSIKDLTDKNQVKDQNEEKIVMPVLITDPPVKSRNNSTSLQPRVIKKNSSGPDAITKALTDKNQPVQKTDNNDYKPLPADKIMETAKDDSRTTPVKNDDRVPVKTNELKEEVKEEKKLSASANDKTGDREIPKKEDQKIKLSKKTPGSLFLFASLAPDISVVGTSQAGKIKLANGIGAGYSKGRVTVRSGFFTARKVYDAYPKDYKAPAEFYTYYPNLQEIKADCRVYEIPLLVSYSLGKKKNWFATTGLSSYLMKRETYDYYYKYTPTSPTVNRQRTIRNANNHYFSVVTLSAGYQLPLNNRVSLVAEPYVKFPLSGVGFGKVKLNSAGVMVSATFKPFLFKNKK